MFVSKTEVAFDADECNNRHREYPGEDDQGIIPAPVFDEYAARVDSSDDDGAAHNLGDDNSG